MREFRNACGKFATGIVVITTEHEGMVHGMTANGFMSVSLDPNLILISIDNNKRMHKLLKESKKYAISILAHHQERWSRHFAGSPQEDFAVEFQDFHGAKVITDAVAYFETSIVSQHEEGDHTLFVGKVNHFECNEQDPILFFKGSYMKLV